MWLFYVFASLLLWQGIISLRNGIKFYAFVRDVMNGPERQAEFQPFASVIAPCRGVEQGLSENVGSLLAQNYPAYEVIFVSDSSDDQGLSVIRKVIEDYPGRLIRSKFVIAGAASDSGQKVHNLCAAVREASSESHVLVFVDTDVRPGPDWLRSLVAPLQDERIGAATGYRWFIPERGGLASHLRSVWNASIASALGTRSNRNFCWGGSTAIRTDTFKRLNVHERWKGTLSDDFALTAILQAAKLPVLFVPRCLTPSFEDCTFHELVEFTTRQIKITRVYAAPLWKAVLAGSTLFVLVFFGGIALVTTRMLQGSPFLAALIMITGAFLLGVSKAFVRSQAIKLALGEYGTELRRGLPAQLILWPLASALYLYNSIAAAFSRRIRWRGITYELKSSSETVIIHRD